MQVTKDMVGKEIHAAIVYKGNVMEVETDTCYFNFETGTTTFHVELTNKDLRLLEVFKKGAKE